MRHIFSYMRRNLPMTQILILGILPRGAWSLPNPYQWPNRLTEGIALVNNASQVSSLSALPRSSLHSVHSSVRFCWLPRGTIPGVPSLVEASRYDAA